MIEQATKEARLKALKAANEALVKPNRGAERIEFDPFADDAVPGPSSKVSGSSGRAGGAKCPLLPQPAHTAY